MAVVLEESTIATPGAAFFVPEGWNNEVLRSSSQEYVQNILEYMYKKFIRRFKKYKKIYETWNEEVSMSMGKVTIDQRAWASL